MFILLNARQLSATTHPNHHPRKAFRQAQQPMRWYIQKELFI